MNWFTDRAASCGPLFGEDFDMPAVAAMPAPEASAAPEPVPDLAMERQAAWDAGFAAGHAAGRAGQGAQAKDALRLIATELNTAREDLLRQAEHTAEELSRFLLTALGQAMPALCARHGAAEIAAIAAEVLPPLAGEPRVRVQVSPERAPDLRGLLATLDAEITDRLELTTVPELGPSDIIVRWRHGTARRDARAIWESILAILAPHGIAPMRADAGEPTKELASVE